MTTNKKEFFFFGLALYGLGSRYDWQPLLHILTCGIGLLAEEIQILRRKFVLATATGDGTFTGSDGICYDGATHTATVDVVDDGGGKLRAAVTYDEDAGGISFGNTVLVRTGFEFSLYYFGGLGTFDFKMTAVDAQGTPRPGIAADYSDARVIVDDGARAFTATVQNGAFSDVKASIVFPELAYVADGDYYYLIESSASDVVVDKASFLAHVVVEDGQEKSRTFDLIYDGVNLGPTDDLAFYNNAAVNP